MLHEYDEKVRTVNSFSSTTLTTVQFVYPRVNPVRKDAAVMTHESEMVNVWE